MHEACELLSPLGQRHRRGVLRVVLVDVGDAELVAREGVRRQGGQAVRRADPGAVDRSDHVTALQSPRVRRRAGVDLADQRARAYRGGEAAEAAEAVAALAAVAAAAGGGRR